MNENEYVSKINGYLVKDSEARDEIENIKENYLNLSNITELTNEVTIESGETVGSASTNFPTGYNINNTKLLYASYEYSSGETGKTMIFSGNIGVAFSINDNLEESIYITVKRDTASEISRTYTTKIGLIKMSESNGD